MMLFKNTLQLVKPIFIIGCARSGTTALSAPLYFHPQVGPKPLPIDTISLQDFTTSLLHYDRHLEFSEKLEQKTLWFEFFEQQRPLTDMGRELIREELGRSQRKKVKQLMSALTKGFVEERFLSKAPTNSFRVLALKELFPDAKFIAIHRNGCDVVNSWGARPYGFSKMCFQEGIAFFALKWNETIDYLFSLSGKVELLHVRYEDFVQDTPAVLSRVFRFCELDKHAVACESLKLQDRNGQWRTNIPSEYHAFLLEKTMKNRIRLKYDSD
jgi:hypothetical protein